MSRSFEDLVALQARLLDPNGCPWDREQTHASLRTYLLEEAYEVLETIDAGNYEKLAGELGDLLLQVVFHAELARRAGRFEIGDVIEGIHSKMVRRHPHVFGDQRAENSSEVLRNWEQLKAEERRQENGDNGEGESLLDGVPHTLPATLEAFQLTRRASRIGFDWDELEDLLEKIAEEAAELRATASGATSRSGDTDLAKAVVADSRRQEEPRSRIEEEVGDLLFVAVNVARFLHVDPEIALKKANRKFQSRFRWMEQEARRNDRKLADVPRDEMERLWDRAKIAEKPGSGGGGK